MLSLLTSHLKAIHDFSENEITFFLSLVEFKSYKKYDSIFKHGDFCRYVAFINRGMIRFYDDTPEKDYTLNLFTEGFWFTDHQAFMMNTPTLFRAEAMEDTEIFTLTQEALHKIYSYSPAFEYYGRVMAENNFLAFIKREKAIRMKTPKERYLMLLEDFPEVANRAPLKYIASMLGFEPETLSRIRKQLNAEI